MPYSNRFSRLTSALILLFGTQGCQESTPPGSPLEPPEISVRYVCGSTFELQNHASTAQEIAYHVLGTSEQGQLALPPQLDSNIPSTTPLVTLQSGGLRVSHDGNALAPVANEATPCPTTTGDPKTRRGNWSPPFPWPVVAVHLHLLPDGKVLSWGAVGTPQVWDPETGEFVAAPSNSNLFCSGHAFLPDGRLLVTGGHISFHHGIPDANLFDPGTTTWSPITSMSRGRWYPTSTTLPDGEVLTIGGRDQDSVMVDVPEVWNGSSWRRLTSANRSLPYYPRSFVAPNGRVFYAGELQETAYLDPSGTGQWIPVATSHYGRRDYGSAVMYRPGKVLIVGGSDPPDGRPTGTAEVIDLTEVQPLWRYTNSMAHPRRQFNTTVLPDGRVLATGGTSSSGFSDLGGAVHAAELWDPVTGSWSLLADNMVARVYHSTALLLRDGRVLAAGSGDGAGLPRELSAELYSPPYLFRGPRPVAAAIPPGAGYGEQFLIATPDAGRIIRVALVRLGSVTHGFDQNQRFLELAFERVAGGLRVTAPNSSALAPPGDYLVFILNEAGVPSVGRTIRIR